MLKRKYIVRFMAGLLLVVASLFGWLEYKRSSQLKALAEMGFPVTPEAMLKYYGEVPDEENAWVVLDGLEKQFQYPEELMPNVPIVGDAEWGVCGENAPMPQEVLAASEVILALNAKQLETLHEACRRPYLRISGKVTKEGYVRFDNYGAESRDLREFTRFIMLEGHMALEKKDYVIATKDFMSGMQLSNFQGQQTGFLAPLVQIALLSMPLALVPPILQANPSSDELLSDVLRSLQVQEALLSPSRYFSLGLADEILGSYEVPPVDPNRWSKFFNELVLIEENGAELTRYLAIPYDKFYMRYILVFLRYDFLKEVATKNINTHTLCKNASTASHDRFGYFRVTRDASNYPVVDVSSIDSHFRHLSELRFWQVAVNLKRFNLKYGRYPAALAELQPEFFDVLPVAPVEDTDWEYTVNAEGCKLHFSITTSTRVQNMDISLPNP